MQRSCQSRRAQSRKNCTSWKSCIRFFSSITKCVPSPISNEPLVRATRKLVEERLRTLAGSYLIPLGDDHQRRNLDPLRVVVWLARVPVIAVFLGPARWAAQHWGAL